MFAVCILMVFFSKPCAILKGSFVAHTNNRILIIAGMAKIKLNKWGGDFWIGFPDQRVGKAMVVDACFFIAQQISKEVAIVQIGNLILGDI